MDLLLKPGKPKVPTIKWRIIDTRSHGAKKAKKCGKSKRHLGKKTVVLDTGTWNWLESNK